MIAKGRTTKIRRRSCQRDRLGQHLAVVTGVRQAGASTAEASTTADPATATTATMRRSAAIDSGRRVSHHDREPTVRVATSSTTARRWASDAPPGRHRSSRTTRSAGCVGERDPPVRVLLVGAGLVDRPPVGDEIGSATPSSRQGVRASCAYRATTTRQDVVVGDDRLEGDLGPSSPASRSATSTSSRSALVLGALLLERAGEQTQPLADLEVLTAQVARGRRQVVGRDGAEAGLAPVLWCERLTAPALLEPADGRAEHAPLARDSSRTHGSTTPRSSPMTTAPARRASSARMPTSASWS